MKFCAYCGVELGFFSKRKLHRSDGQVVEVCKACSSRDTASPPSPQAFTGAAPDRLSQLIVARYRAESGVDLTRDQLAMQRIQEAAPTILETLALKGECKVDLPFITADANGPKHLAMVVRRADLS